MYYTILECFRYSFVKYHQNIMKSSEKNFIVNIKQTILYIIYT